MSVRNAYPNVPVVPYKKTTVSRSEAAAYIASLNVSDAIKASAYTIFLIESGNGKKGINNNYAGIQADGGKIGRGMDNRVIATTVIDDNAPGYTPRRFVVFEKWQHSIDYTVALVSGRGLFIGGYAKPYANMQVTGVTTLCIAYYREFVTGTKTYQPTVKQFGLFGEKYAEAKAELYLAVPEQKKK